MEPSVQNMIASAEVTTSRRGSFWVGIEPVAGPVGTVMRGPMFVEWEAPADPRPGPPWVLVHGGGGQAIDYTITFDGRPGWSRLLVEQGYTVFVVDRPGHGRSPHHPDVLGPMGPQLGFEFLRPIFVPPPEGPDSNPAAHLHTQWAGGREPGDPVFDQCLCASGPTLADAGEMHRLEQARLAELLDLVGPAIVITHSAGGPGTFAGVDARPDKVAALFAIETLGPPFLKRPELGPIPITLQREPARRLANLSRFPIAVVTAEASMFLGFDRHLVEFLAQGGCDVELVRLADHGVHGNGHMIMSERNNAQTLAVLTDWAARKLA